MIDRPALEAAVRDAGAILTVQDILRLTTLSRSTLVRQVRRGEFPAPVSLSPRRVGWRKADLVSWMQSLELCDPSVTPGATR